MTYTQESLTQALKALKAKGWVPTTRPGNDGGVGNTLEDHLGIQENNLSVADAGVFEIKARRRSTTSLQTLFHKDPWPRRNPAMVTEVLLPKYGWPHKEAGAKYPEDEMSFRATLKSQRYTRGFTVGVDWGNEQVRVKFDATKVDTDRDRAWLDGVLRVAGPGDITPPCHWPWEKLRPAVETKVASTIYVVADNRRKGHHEEFHFNEAWLMTEITFEGFLEAIEQGVVHIDFDARSGHNHGTKFRIPQDGWPSLFRSRTPLL